jgi:hypothetical protein
MLGDYAVEDRIMGLEQASEQSEKGVLVAIAYRGSADYFD